jgi:hypothetical protein
MARTLHTKIQGMAEVKVFCSMCALRRVVVWHS